MQENLILKTSSEVNSKGSLGLLLVGLFFVLYTILIGIFKLSTLLTIGCIVVILLLFSIILMQLGKVYLVYQDQLSIQSLWAYRWGKKEKEFVIPIQAIKRVEIIDSSDNYLNYPAFNHIRIFHKGAKDSDFTKFTIKKDKEFESLLIFIAFLERARIQFLIQTDQKKLQNRLADQGVKYKSLT